MALKYSLRITYFFSQMIRRQRQENNRGLYRVCGLIRSSMRRNLRVRQGASSPGTPPSAHTSGGLRVIAFSVANNTGYIGSVKFPGSNFFDSPVPHIQEFGGIYASRLGFSDFPKRSYAEFTLDQLNRKGLIPRTFVAKVI